MKKTIMALVASTFIAGVAHAAPAPVTFTGHATTGAECSAQFDEIGGINVKELSERKQCLAVVHDIDTMFTHKTFWVRTGNQFVAFDVEDIAKMSRSERGEFIKNTVIKEVVREVIVEKIVVDEERVTELEAEVKALEAAKSALEMAYGEQSDAVAALNETLMTAEMALEEAVKSVETLAETIEMLNEAHEVAITETATASFTAGAASRDGEVAGLQGELATAKADLAVANQQRDNYISLYGVFSDLYKGANAEVTRLNGEVERLEAELMNAFTQADIDAAVSANTHDLLFGDGVVVDGVRVSSIASVIGSDATTVDELFQEIREQSDNVEDAAYALLDAGIHGSYDDAMNAILNGTAYNDITMALLQAYIDGQMSVYVPTAPSDIDERIEQGIEDAGLTVRTTGAEALTTYNEWATEAAIAFGGNPDQFTLDTVEQLYGYVSVPSNADSVAQIAEATGIDFSDVNWGRDADGNALVFATYSGSTDAFDSRGEFTGYNVTFVTSAGEFTVERVQFVNSGLANFSNGFTDGFERGFQAGYNAGYNDGYNDGFRDGYSQGFQAGVDSVS